MIAFAAPPQVKLSSMRVVQADFSNFQRADVIEEALCRRTLWFCIGRPASATNYGPTRLDFSGTIGFTLRGVEATTVPFGIWSGNTGQITPDDAALQANWHQYSFAGGGNVMLGENSSDAPWVAGPASAFPTEPESIVANIGGNPYLLRPLHLLVSADRYQITVNRWSNNGVAANFELRSYIRSQLI